MAIKFIIDSSSDITLKEANELNVKLLPMTVTIGKVDYASGTELSADEFYKKLEETKEFPITSQIPPSVYEEEIKKIIKNGDIPYIITISSGFSGTYQSALIAASEAGAGKVYVTDSKNAALGEAILIRYAVYLRDKGLSADEIHKTLEAAREKIRVFALVDTLEYLKKGGRISAATATVGGILGIKPLLAIEDGKIKSLGKARGLKSGYTALNDFIKKCDIDYEKPFSYAYSGLDSTPLNDYIETSRELFKDSEDKKTPVMQIGATIGTHAGPGAVAVAFFAK